MDFFRKNPDLMATVLDGPPNVTTLGLTLLALKASIQELQKQEKLDRRYLI